MRLRDLTTVSGWLVAVVALVVATAMPALAHEAKHDINGSSIKRHSIAGNRLKNNTLTGVQVKESTLGKVPKAANAERLGGVPAANYERSVMWAYVNADGSVGRQSGGISVNAIYSYSGTYFVTFPASVANDALSATLHWDQTGNQNGYVSVAVCGDTSATDSPTSGAVKCSAGANNAHEAYVHTDPADTHATSLEQGFYITVTP